MEATLNLSSPTFPPSPGKDCIRASAVLLLEQPSLGFRVDLVLTGYPVASLKLSGLGGGGGENDQ